MIKYILTVATASSLSTTECIILNISKALKENNKAVYFSQLKTSY